MPIDASRLRQIAARHRRADPGPYVFHRKAQGQAPKDSTLIATLGEGRQIRGPLNPNSRPSANAAFLADSWLDVADLLEHIEAQAADLAESRRQMAVADPERAAALRLVETAKAKEAAAKEQLAGLRQILKDRAERHAQKLAEKDHRIGQLRAEPVRLRPKERREEIARLREENAALKASAGPATASIAEVKGATDAEV